MKASETPCAKRMRRLALSSRNRWSRNLSASVGHSFLNASSRDLPLAHDEYPPLSANPAGSAAGLRRQEPIAPDRWLGPERRTASIALHNMIPAWQEFQCAVRGTCGANADG